MNFPLLTFLMLLLTTHTHAVKIFAGVFFKQLEHGVAYESSVPLTYEADFPETQQDVLQAESVFWPTCHQADCNMADAVQMLYNSTNSILMSGHQAMESSLHMGPPTTRKTRAIEALGDFFHFCCSVATDGELHKLEFNEQKVTDHLNAFQGLVSDDHKDLIKISRNLKLFAGNFSQQFHEAYTKLTDNVKLLIQKNQHQEETLIIDQLLAYIFHLYSHVNILSRQEYISTTKERCDKKLLFSSLVNPNLLRTDLFKLEKRYKLKGYQLAIPLSDLQRYFDLPLTTCVFKDNAVVFSVKVPLIRTEGRYQLYQYISAPMYFKGQSCRLQQREFILAKREQDGAVQLIAGQHLATCKPQTDFLCYLPRQRTDGHMSTSCINHLLTSEEHQDIHKLCELDCIPAGDRMEIVEYSPTEFIISNIQENSTVECKEGSSHQLRSHPGASYVELPCDCSIMERQRELVRKTFPCHSQSSSSLNIQHFLPLNWVKFNSLKIDVLKPHLNPKFSNISEILKDEIEVQLPDLMIHDRISSNIFEKIELPNDWGSIVNSTSFVFYIVFGWLSILSILCVYLAIKLYILKLSTLRAEKSTIQIVDR